MTQDCSTDTRRGLVHPGPVRQSVLRTTGGLEHASDHNNENQQEQGSFLILLSRATRSHKRVGFLCKPCVVLIMNNL
jgi:hypothetical protein